MHEAVLKISCINIDDNILSRGLCLVYNLQMATSVW